MPNTHSPQDDHLRRKLAAAPVPPRPADGWDRLEARLATDSDLALREKLTGLAAAAPTGWNDLERRLDPHTEADVYLRETLRGLEPALPAGAWATFSEVYDAELGRQVDAVVVERIGGQAARPVSGWAALAERLELIRDRRSRLMAGGITELALMASLLLLFVQFFVGKPIDDAAGTVSAPVAASVTVPPAAEARARTDRTPPGSGEEPASAAATVADDVAASLSSPGTSVSSPSALATRDGKETAGLASRVAVAKLPTPDLLPLKTADGLLGVARPTRAAGAVAPLDTRPIFARRAAHPPNPALRLPPAADLRPSIWTIYVNAFVSPIDVNQTVTPEQAILDLDVIADTRFTRGNSGGLSLDFESGSSEMSLGLVVNRMAYVPTALKWFAQDEFPLVETVKGYGRFRYTNLNLPFSYGRRVWHNDKWRLWVRGTMQLSVVATSRFYVPDGGRQAIVDAFNARAERAAQLAAQRGTLTSGQGRSQTNVSPQTIIDPPGGVFQGGSFFDNATFYLGGGLRVERVLTPRTSIYVAPEISRAVYFDSVTGGVGPYRDRLHLGQVRLGTRFRL